MGKVISVHSQSEETMLGLEWLKRFGARVEVHMGVTLIELPDSAIIEPFTEQTILISSISFVGDDSKVCVLDLDVHPDAKLLESSLGLRLKMPPSNFPTKEQFGRMLKHMSLNPPKIERE